MARLASETKKGFYPTNVKTLKTIVDAVLDLENMKNLTVIDPCCGEGEALEMFTLEYGAKSYGVEIDQNRAAKSASRNIVETLNACALEGVRKNNKWASINFLNPPYGCSSSSKRLEVDFINRWSNVTIYSGVLILVINPSSFDDELVGVLRKNGLNPLYCFEDSRTDEYAKYNQFFLVLQQEKSHFRTDMSKFYDCYKNRQDISKNINIENKIIPKDGFSPKLFKEIVIPRWKVEEMLVNSKVRKKFLNVINQKTLDITSVELPNEGQLAQLIAIGALNDSVRLNDGRDCIIKGSVIKTESSNVRFAENENQVNKVAIHEKYSILFYELDLTNGVYNKYK